MTYGEGSSSLLVLRPPVYCMLYSGDPDQPDFPYYNTCIFFSF